MEYCSLPGLKTGAIQTRSINGALGRVFHYDLIRAEAINRINIIAPGETRGSAYNTELLRNSLQLDLNHYGRYNHQVFEDEASLGVYSANERNYQCRVVA